jgi:hypothetical protein
VVKVVIEPKSYADFMAAIQKYASKSKQTLRDAALEQAALACSDAATFTPPLAKGGGDGLSKAAKKAGEQAIDRDVGKVVVPMSGGTKDTQRARVVKRLGSLALTDNASLFWKVAAKNSPILNSNGFLARMLSDRYNGFGTVWGFKKLRNYFNRIGNKVANESLNQASLQSIAEIHAVYKPIYQREGGRLWKSGRNVSGVEKMSRYVAENKPDLDRYIMQRQKTVGSIKSGWAMALRTLPKPVINGVPKDFGVKLLNAAWITRHKTVQGKNTISSSDKDVDVIVFNADGNINGIADQANVLALVYGNRVKQMPKRIKRLLQQDIDGFNKK